MLQICPHDSAPFGSLCDFYAQAAETLGIQMQTVYLAAPSDVSRPGADYLNQQLTDAAALRAGLDAYAQHDWVLILCHRYRAYWSAATSTLDNRLCVAVAHEYGLLKRWQRRLGRRWRAFDVQFAGIAPDIRDELAAIMGHAHLLPNGVDIEQALAQQLPKEQARQHLGITQTKMPVVGVVGRLHYKKRPELALESVQCLMDAGSAVQLVFVGDGDLREALVKQAGENSTVHFCGNVPQAARLFSAFDVLLHTAQGEAFGMVALEAMLAGVPVVAQPTQGPAYVLGELGCYAERDSAAGYAAALEQALQLDAAEFREAGRTRARQHFSVSAAARRLDDLMFELHQTQ